MDSSYSQTDSSGSYDPRFPRQARSFNPRLARSYNSRSTRSDKTGSYSSRSAGHDDPSNASPRHFRTAREEDNRPTAGLRRPGRLSNEDSRSFNEFGVSFSPPNRFMPIRNKDIARLLHEGSNQELRNYIRENIDAMKTAPYILYELKKIVRRFAPEEYRENMDLRELLRVLRNILEVFERRIPLFDISFEGSDILEGSGLAAVIDQSRQKVSDLIEHLQRRVEDAETAAGIWEKIAEQHKEAAEENWERLITLTGSEQYAKPKYMKEDFPADDSFLAELQAHLKMQKQMNSSLQEELATEEKSKNELIQEVLHLKGQAIQEEHDRMNVVANIVKKLELEEVLKTSITQRIQSLAPKPEDVSEAVDSWMNAVREKISPKKEEIEHLVAEIASVEDELAKLKVEYESMNDKYAEVQDKIENIQEEYEIKLEEFENQESELQAINYSIQVMNDTIKQKQERASSLYSTPIQSQGAESLVSPPYYDARSTPQHGMAQSGTRYTPELRQALDETYQSRTPDSSRTSGPEYSDYLDESPERPRFGSPEFYPRYYTQSSPISIDSTPHSHLSFSASPPSPIRLTAPSPLLQSYAGTAAKTPGTETVSHPSSRLSSRSPVRTPDQFVTPFISKTRFGYTDPTAKVLNLPPGDDLEIPSAYKQKFLLPSPGRKNPIVVDIGVDPKPLVQTATGEHFVCDISLSLQPSGQQQEMSPVFTYDSPPAVTPTTARRHGLFTPKGIFQKKHFNVRRIHSPEEYESPDLPWSPQYLPKDARSPITYLPQSPNYSDRSISWERSPERPFVSNLMNRTFEAPPAFNRTFEARSPRGMNRTFNKSPVQPLNTTFDATSPYIMNRTFESSPQRMDATFNRSGHPDFNRTFDASSPNVLGRTFDASSPRTMNKTFDRSPSPALNQTFDKTRSPGFNKTFDRSPSPALNQTFDTTRSPRFNETFDRSPSPALNQTFDTTRSPRFNETFDRSPSPALNQTFNKTGSPDDDRKLDQSPLNRTFNFGTSPAVNKTFDRSRSPSPYRTFSRSQSPRLSDRSTPFNKTLNRINSPKNDTTFDSTRSGDLSMSPDLDEAFISPRSNKTFDSSLSPESSGSDDPSNSPRPIYIPNVFVERPSNTTFDLSTNSASDRDEPEDLNKSFHKPSV